MNLHTARIRATAPVLAVGLLGTSAAILIHLVDPNQPGHYPTCPSLWLTGLYCPGCGAMRAVHALTHGDLLGALAMNPLTVAVLPYLGFVWGAWLWRSITGRPFRSDPPGWAVALILVTVLAFGVLRNLPGFEWLAPGGLPANA